MAKRKKLADILQFRFGPCSNKITIEPYYYVNRQQNKKRRKN
jgi:hypothetical protein